MLMFASSSNRLWCVFLFALNAVVLTYQRLFSWWTFALFPVLCGLCFVLVFSPRIMLWWHLSFHIAVFGLVGQIPRSGVVEIMWISKCNANRWCQIASTHKGTFSSHPCQLRVFKFLMILPVRRCKVTSNTHFQTPG